MATIPHRKDNEPFNNKGPRKTSMLLQLFLADFEQLLCAEYTITEICSKWPILKTQQYCFSFLVSDFDNNFVKRSKTPGSFWPLIFYKNWEINPSQATLFLYPWKQPKTRRFLMFSAGTERDKWHEMRQWQEFKICNSKNYKFFFQILSYLQKITRGLINYVQTRVHTGYTKAL